MFAKLLNKLIYGEGKKDQVIYRLDTGEYFIEAGAHWTSNKRYATRFEVYDAITIVTRMKVHSHLNVVKLKV